MTQITDKRYLEAARLSEEGNYPQAQALYEELEQDTNEDHLQSLVLNDLGALCAVEGNPVSAQMRFESALEIDPDCHPAKINLAALKNSDTFAKKSDPHTPRSEQIKNVPRSETRKSKQVKIAIVSFLFNWPSTGGGNIHTVELAQFLTRAGYDVRLYYAHFPNWGIGNVDATCPVPVEELHFTPSEWTIRGIKERFRHAVDLFGPDHVLITDSWNFKPHLADAMTGYSYFLRMQAQECLCPLNNLRLLPADGGFTQCANTQLESSEECFNCLSRYANSSGGLHQADRQLSAVGTAEYNEVLHRALQQAEGVLVLNPEIAELYRPYCKRVEVVTWGMDESRFGWPPMISPRHLSAHKPVGTKRILFAGLAHEQIKGFHVIRETCERLWQRRRDFQLVVTSDPPAEDNAAEEFIRYVGWQSQQELPLWYRGSDICVVPTIAQDGLSRTSVEAMASGLPVVASRIGGLPYTVTDNVTGLLCEPGNIEDWSEKLERLLDDSVLRQTMGAAGRKQFEERFTWDSVIEQQYRPLLIPTESAPHRALKSEGV